jgi:hypothetical protein
VACIFLQNPAQTAKKAARIFSVSLMVMTTIGQYQKSRYELRMPGRYNLCYSIFLQITMEARAPKPASKLLVTK